MTSPAPTSGGGEFVLDLGKADIAIRNLENVYAELASIRTDASRLASTERTARDAVSLEAFDLLSQRADGAPGSLGVALEGAMQHVQGLIEQMRSDVAEQVALDARGARAAAGRG